MAHPSFLSSQRDALHLHHVFVDTDIGDDIDDALALALLLHSPEVTVHGVTTVFGDTMARARLAKHLLTIFGHADIPVAPGYSMPLQLRHRPSAVPQAVILDPQSVLSLSPLSAPALLLETALAHQGELTLLCLGPLTNIALALQQDARLISSLKQIFFMGGTAGFPWPDWNVRSDARAAQIVLAAGVPITMIGWNVTKRVHLRSEDVQSVQRAEGPHTQLLSSLIRIWQQDRFRFRTPLPSLHDPLVVTALCLPQLFRFETIPVRVLGQTPLVGFTVPRMLGGWPVRAAMNVQAEQAREWIRQRLLVQF